MVKGKEVEILSYEGKYDVPCSCPEKVLHLPEDLLLCPCLGGGGGGGGGGGEQNRKGHQ